MSKKKNKSSDKSADNSVVIAAEKRDKAIKRAAALYQDAEARRGKQNKYAQEKLQKEIKEIKSKPSISSKSKKLV